MNNEQVNEYVLKISEGILDVQRMIAEAPSSFHDHVDTTRLEKQLLDARGTASRMFRFGLGPKRTKASK